MWCFGILLQEKDKSPNVVFVDPFYMSRVVILLKELIESIKKADIPLNGLWTLILGLAGQFESLD